MVKETSAMPSGLRPSVPLKITSAISPPRNAFADCSPSTQRMAAEIRSHSDCFSSQSNCGLTSIPRRVLGFKLPLITGRRDAHHVAVSVCGDGNLDVIAIALLVQVRDALRGSIVLRIGAQIAMD